MKKLEIKNEWMSYIYILDGKEVDPDTIVSVALIDGDTYRIKKVVEKEVSYHDMGHKYYTTQKHLYIDVNGFDVNITESIINNQHEVFVDAIG